MFKAVHKKGFYMVHCWDKLMGAQMWQTSFAAYDEAVKNGIEVNVDSEDDDHGRHVLPPRPRGNKATKADLAREAQAIVFTQSLQKLMAENQASMAKRDEKKRLEKKPQLPSTSTSRKRSLRSKEWTSRPKRQTPRPNCVTPRPRPVQRTHGSC
ncbi:hypothetical protein QYE76_001665 [Lolium multiflorum]|uniref:Uncharacterized protein n=1 Tax=Lolium multiflorum TaxID=4521 RepID=A0AAD8RL43_LOLMU|nr:hypothetical protein QYE76_001665 [Lolium multiflorum]